MNKNTIDTTLDLKLDIKNNKVGRIKHKADCNCSICFGTGWKLIPKSEIEKVTNLEYKDHYAFFCRCVFN